VGKRQNLVDDFQRDSGAPYFVLSLKAGGTGLNLTKASHVIHFDRWWNPGVENQATDRAYRIGQKKNVLVHKFICQGTIEERIDAMIDAKRALAENLVEASSLASPLTELSNEEIFEMVRLDLGSL
jgi:non-specific serine/threonine protein kinase